MAKKKDRRKPEKVETKNFSGQRDHYSIGYKRVTIKTKEGEEFEGTVVYCDYDRVTIELESDTPDASILSGPSITIAWDDVKKFINWGWSKFWLKMEAIGDEDADET